MSYPALLLCGLAAYRIAYLLALESGPFSIGTRWRTVVAGMWGTQSWQYDGASCPRCLSFWLVPLALAAWDWGGIIGQSVVTWLAVAGAILILHVWLMAQTRGRP